MYMKADDTKAHTAEWRRERGSGTERDGGSAQKTREGEGERRRRRVDGGVGAHVHALHVSKRVEGAVDLLGTAARGDDGGERSRRRAHARPAHHVQDLEDVIDVSALG
eukprot:6211757-Pleurochrysis_carterae.AAC.3